MKKFLMLCTALLAVLTLNAQFVSFPDFGKHIKMSGDPVIGLEGLSIGDEGYITFEITNFGDSIYKGPIYIRIIEHEHSVQVLAAQGKKIKPGRSYSITTVFSTERLNPYARYFVAFEYNENGHTVPMGFTEPKPLKNFMLLPAIINNPQRKAPVKARIREIKKSK